MNWNSTLAAFLTATIVVGCAQTAGQGDITSLNVDSLPYKKGAIVMAGSSIGVDLALKRDGEDILFVPSTHGTVLDMEIERYRKTPQGVLLVIAGGESYVPPIPLLKPGFSIGQIWNWDGEVLLARSGTVDPAQSTKQKASATISLGQEQLNIPTGPFDALKINVELLIHDGTKPPAKRALVFWIDPKRGVVKREFAYSSTRIPVSNSMP